MILTSSGRGSYRWLTITLVVGAGAYAWYAVGQYARLNDLNQRQLSNAGAELKAGLDTAVETVRRFNSRWQQTSKASQSDAAPVCDFDRNQPYLDLFDPDQCTPRTAKPVSWGDFSIVAPVTDPTLAIEAHADPRDGGSTTFRFRIDKVLQELAFPDSFGLIFVATDTGKVLYQESPTRRLWLRHLRWGEQTFRDAHADRPPSLQIQNIAEVLDGGADEWGRLRSVSSRTSVRLGGTAHQLYLQPLVLENRQRIELIVGGAVPTRMIVRDALALDTYLVGVLVFLLLLGFLGFPFVKLASLDAHERFGLRDIKLLYLSTGALLALFTCGSLAVDGYVRWQRVAREGLQAWATSLDHRVLREIEAIRDQIADYDAQLARLSKTDCEKWPVQTNWFQSPPAKKPFRIDPPPEPVNLRTIMWIRPDGWQMWKSTADSIPGKTRVDQRVYFRSVHDGHLFQVAGTGRPIFVGPDRSVADGKFYTFVSMESRIPARVCPGLKGFNSPPVVAATAQLLSLDRQPLPAGYGFALASREGRVLYHSDRRLSLRESFFEELSNGARARALMYAGESGHMSGRYRERPHAFYFRPLALLPEGEAGAGPFYLAAFRDTSIERALMARAFVAGVAGPMALLLAMYAAALWGVALVSRRIDRRWSGWLWPHGGLDHVYRWQAVAFLALLLVGVASMVRTNRVGLLVATPLLAAAIGIATYVLGRARATARRKLSAGGWHTCALVLLLVCMIVAPSTALFRLVMNHEFGRLIWTERAWIQDQEADAVRAAEVDALSENYASSKQAERAVARRASFTCVPAPFDATGPLADIRSARGRRLALLPVVHAGGAASPGSPGSDDESAAISFARSCGRLIGRDPAAPSNGSQTLQAGHRDAMLIHALNWLDDLLPVEHVVLSRQRFQDPELSYSPDGTILPSIGASSVMLVTFGVMLALLAWWIRWNTNRLFLANEETNGPADGPPEPIEELWERRTLDEQMVLIQIARGRVANPYQRPLVKHLLGQGLLRLDPDLQPYSEAFTRFLAKKERELHARVREWEHVSVGHSWQYVRLILVASLAGLAFFLIATQPSLHSGLLGVATSIGAVLSTALKFRDELRSWFSSSKSAA